VDEDHSKFGSEIITILAKTLNLLTREQMVKLPKELSKGKEKVKCLKLIKRNLMINLNEKRIGKCLHLSRQDMKIENGNFFSGFYLFLTILSLPRPNPSCSPR
jgi:hypothetical protein